MQKIIESILNILFLGFGSKLKGIRTVLFNILTGVVVLIEFFTDKVHALLCDVYATGCESQFWATLASISVVVNMALRYVTDTPVGSQKP